MRLLKPTTGEHSCLGCPGLEWDGGYGFSNNEGSGTNGVLVVGESLGQQELNDGLPFRPHAVSGSLLERAFREWGQSRSQFRLANILKCHPPKDWLDGAPWEFDAIAHCRPYLDHEISTMKPRCILALGGTALRELTGMSGKYRGISYLRGYALPLVKPVKVPAALHACVGEGCFECDGTGHHSSLMPTGIPVVGSFHPSFIRRGSEGEGADRKGNMRLFGILLHDLKVAMEIARVGQRPPQHTRYQPQPSLDDILSFEQRVRDNPTLMLSYDIETPDSAEMDEDERDEDRSAVITQIQFSLGVGEGIVLRPEHMDIARRIIALSNPKVGHNCFLFDMPKMQANKFEFGGPLSHDTMVAFHIMQPDLPKNLQFVASFYQMDRPWKHLSSTDMGQYGCCDVDAPLRIMAQLPDQLRKRGLWDGYYRRTYQVRPILADMESLGIPINDQERVKFGDELDAAKLVEWDKMQALVPEECREVHPKQGYKKVPKDTTELVERVFGVPQQPLGDVVLTDALVTRWCRIEPFTPSPKQLLRYMRHRGHPVPKNFKTGRDTTAAVELERLERKTGDFLYRYVRTYREIQTMKGTFVDGWKPSSDGRVHTTFTFKPATMQLSSRDPNVQNYPVHTGLAEKFQRVIEAPDGYTLVKCVAPETKILYGDLIWRTASSVQVGDVLWGFDEQPMKVMSKSKRRMSRRAGRYLRKTVVTKVTRARKPCLRITLDTGSVICSVDHNWLKRVAGTAHWIKASKLRVGHKIAFFTKPWEPSMDRDVGWLAGFIDGEGFASSGRSLAFSQNDGIVADHAVQVAARLGFEVRKRKVTKGYGHKCSAYSFVGGQFTWLRALGIIRPIRLLPQVIEKLEGTAYWGKGCHGALVQHIEDLGEQEVIAIETDRHTFIAEGLLSHNCDHRSFHALTLGILAGDEVYTRVARIDVHSFVTSEFLHLKPAATLLAMQDDELADYLSWVKHEHEHTRNFKIKRVILGWQYGRGYKAIYQAYREDFTGETESKRMVETLERCFPKAVEYRTRVLHEAEDKHYLTTPYGFIRWFWDVLDYRPPKEGRAVRRCNICGRHHSNGNQAEEAIAYRPANCAFGMMRDEVLDLREHEYDRRYGLISNVHDSWEFCCPNSLVDECVHTVAPLMERPSSLMTHPTLAPNGLSCEVETKVGKSAARMEKVNVARARTQAVIPDEHSVIQ